MLLHSEVEPQHLRCACLTRNVMTELHELVASSCAFSAEEYNPEMAATPGLNYFGLITHGFGTSTMSASLSAVLQYLHELQATTRSGSATSSCSSDSGVSMDEDANSDASLSRKGTKRR